MSELTGKQISKILEDNRKFVKAKEQFIKMNDEDIIEMIIELDLYKSVIDEVREVLKGHFSTYASCVKALDEIEEILDKANKESE